MTQVEQLAAFVVGTTYDDLSQEARRELKLRVLDGLGCSIGALKGPPIKMLEALLEDFGGNPRASLIGGGKTAPNLAAFYNAALVCYLDFNDTYLAKNEICHPSDNLGAVLGASEYAGKSGKDFLTALAVAYQVQGRLSDLAPLRAKGFDHITLGAYAVAAGVAKALGLGQKKTANALAISGAANNALGVTRTGSLSDWKSLAYPHAAFAATTDTFLAMHGISGPLKVFEGEKGFMAAMAGNFEIDWLSEDLELVRRTNIKKYNTDFYAQSALEGILELRAAHHLSGDEIKRIEVEIFDAPFNIISGENGKKLKVQTREEAEHSLPYILAAALLDGEVTPRQYTSKRIERHDVQTLMRKVEVRPNPELSELLPEAMPCRIQVFLNDGRTLVIEKEDYEGFYTRPMSWSKVAEKFEQLARPFTDEEVRRGIIEAVARLERIEIRQLTELLTYVRKEE